jgi:CP family cyanate transporter-like MFS transporter
MPLAAAWSRGARAAAGEDAVSVRDSSGPATRQRAGSQLGLLVLLVFVGANLRSILLGVPPVLPLIQRDLSLTHTAIGLLTALPVLCMGLAAWPSGWLAGKLGGRWAVALGLGLLTAGGLLRAAWPLALPLYVFTVLLSLGIAVSQTRIIVLMRIWFPDRIGLVSALYTDGIIAGEALSAGLTVPVILHWLGPDAWRGSFVAWSLPALAALALWLWVAPARADSRAARQPLAPERPARPEHRGRERGVLILALRLGLLSGCGSLLYFGMNAWIAPFDTAFGHSGMASLALGLLNASQLPVSLALTPLAQRLAGERLPFVLAGCVCVVCIAGWVAAPYTWQPLWAALLGASGVSTLALGIGLPPLFATRENIGRLAGGALSVSYSLGFLGPLIGGRLWDLSGHAAFAFLPVGAAGFGLIALGATLPSRHPHPPASELLVA